MTLWHAPHDTLGIQLKCGTVSKPSSMMGCMLRGMTSQRTHSNTASKCHVDIKLTLDTFRQQLHKWQYNVLLAIIPSLPQEIEAQGLDHVATSVSMLLPDHN